MNEAMTSNVFKAEVAGRFGLVPNFFCTANSAPGLIENMWGFAKAGYLDSPLPSLFKERLFVHLSRFCEARYCIVRHVGFLIGEGRPAGDPCVLPHTVEQVLGLLSVPVPNADKLERALIKLESQEIPVAIPEPETPLERDLFNALTILFVAPRRAARARNAIASALGEKNFEVLTAFLAFVRTAHFWTETHPSLAYEADMISVMNRHPDLARLMLDTSSAEWANSSESLQRALADLQSTAGTLRTTEERFRALLSAISDVVFRMSPDWSEMWQLDGQGSTANRPGPSRNWLIEYVHPDDQPAVVAAIAKALKTKALFELEHRVKRADGTFGWTLTRAVPLLDEQGHLVEWFGAARDMSARRVVEDDLREGDRRKNEFLATLSHELRSPLAPLRYGLEIARRDAKPGTTLEHTIQIMDRQLKLLVHLVDDLLDLGRISTGKIDLRLARVNLREVLEASVESCRTTMESHGHTFVMDAGPEEMFADGDFDRLTQVFCNLLSNAAKYTDHGGRIEMHMTRDAGAAVVEVSDTGIGIPQSDLPHIFDLFSQVSEHRCRAQGGLGIGLSLVRQLVELHEGTVSASSPGTGSGSTFVVRIPLSEKIAVLEKPARQRVQAA